MSKKIYLHEIAVLESKDVVNLLVTVALRTSFDNTNIRPEFLSEGYRISFLNLVDRFINRRAFDPAEDIAELKTLLPNRSLIPLDVWFKLRNCMRHLDRHFVTSMFDRDNIDTTNSDLWVNKNKEAPYFIRPNQDGDALYNSLWYIDNCTEAVLEVLDETDIYNYHSALIRNIPVKDILTPSSVFSQFETAFTKLYERCVSWPKLKSEFPVLVRKMERCICSRHTGTCEVPATPSSENGLVYSKLNEIVQTPIPVVSKINPERLLDKLCVLSDETSKLLNLIDFYLPKPTKISEPEDIGLKIKSYRVFKEGMFILSETDEGYNLDIDYSLFPMFPKPRVFKNDLNIICLRLKIFDKKLRIDQQSFYRAFCEMVEGRNDRAAIDIEHSDGKKKTVNFNFSSDAYFLFSDYLTLIKSEHYGTMAEIDFADYVRLYSFILRKTSAFSDSIRAYTNTYSSMTSTEYHCCLTFLDDIKDVTGLEINKSVVPSLTKQSYVHLGELASSVIVTSLIALLQNLNQHLIDKGIRINKFTFLPSENGEKFIPNFDFFLTEKNDAIARTDRIKTFRTIARLLVDYYYDGINNSSETEACKNMVCKEIIEAFVYVDYIRLGNHGSEVRTIFENKPHRFSVTVKTHSSVADETIPNNDRTSETVELSDFLKTVREADYGGRQITPVTEEVTGNSSNADLEPVNVTTAVDDGKLVVNIEGRFLSPEIVDGVMNAVIDGKKNVVVDDGYSDAIKRVGIEVPESSLCTVPIETPSEEKTNSSCSVKLDGREGFVLSFSVTKNTTRDEVCEMLDQTEAIKNFLMCRLDYFDSIENLKLKFDENTRRQEP